MMISSSNVPIPISPVNVNNCNTSLDGMTIISPTSSLSPLSTCSQLTSAMSISGCPSPCLSTSSSLSSSTYDPLETIWPKEIDEFSDLALQACHQEVKRASDSLGISTDPFTWTVRDVLSWLSWQIEQISLPMFSLDYFRVDGRTLCSYSEQDFKDRAVYCGDILYAQLDIWKTLSEQEACNGSDMINTSDYSSEGTQSDDEVSQDRACEVSSPSSILSNISSSTSTTSLSQSSSSITSSCGNPVIGSNRNTGSHIHLWQFLKELLGQHQQYGSCIRWLDRNKGIFKIEDSVKVAKLWGRRKNRPAMNYDKLSRSIRQYYKKGIMKKTERSQRLVYQFCQPYCF